MSFIENLKANITKFEGKIASLSIFLSVVSIAGKLLGFFKIHLIARLFGTSKESDIFYAAFALPDLVFALLIVGTVNAALVPIFIKIIKKNDQKILHETLNTVTVLLFFVMLLALAGLYFAMPSLTTIVFANKDVLKAFDLSLSLTQRDSAYYQTLFINQSRLMLVSPLLLAVSSIFGAYLQAHKRFISTSLAPFMYNIGIVIGIFGFVKFAPQFGVYALSYSVLIGTLFHFITQLIGIYSLHDKSFSWSFKINHYVKEIAKLSIPRIFGLGVEQTAIMFNTFWGFTLGTGALSVFKFASTLHSVPVDLISGSFLQVIFPRLNEKAHEEDHYKSLNKLYWRTLLFVCLVAIPIVILFIVLRLPIVRIVFGAGRFSWTATVVTSFTLVFFAPAIILQALAALNIRTFYAINNTRSPFFVSIVGVVLNIIFSIAFTNFFSHYHELVPIIKNPLTWFTSIPTLLSWFTWKNGSFAAVAGLALGITLGLFVEVFASFVLLARKTALWKYANETNFIIPQLKRLITAAAVTFICSYATYRIMDIITDTTRTLGVFFIAAMTSGLTLIYYLIFSRRIWEQYVDIHKIKAKIKGFIGV
jgi:putative peptidoglycan lipid II flippase